VSITVALGNVYVKEPDAGFASNSTTPPESFVAVVLAAFRFVVVVPLTKILVLFWSVAGVVSP
jgi:hypothetical protein